MDLLSAYRAMLRIRIFEDKVLECADRGLVPGAAHPYSGQEAVAVGVLAARLPHEWVVSFYRCHGHALAAGVPARAVMREILGRAGGVCGGKAGSMHLADRSRYLLGASSIVAGQLPVAAGAAMAEKMDGAGRAVVAFCGDGALGAGVSFETLNIVARLGLPLLLVCEDNGWQDQTPSALVRNRTPARVVAGLGLRCVEVDGNDVTAVHEAAAESLGACRSGEPVVLVAHTYLRYFHSQMGRYRPPEYRPDEERAHWAERDPLSRAEAAIRRDADQTDHASEAIERVTRQVIAEMNEVVADALAADEPDPATATTEVTLAKLGWAG